MRPLPAPAHIWDGCARSVTHSPISRTRRSTRPVTNATAVAARPRPIIAPLPLVIENPFFRPTASIETTEWRRSHHHHHRVLDQCLEGPNELGAERAINRAVVA